MSFASRRGPANAAIAAVSTATFLAGEVFFFGRPVSAIPQVGWVVATLGVVALLYTIQIWRDAAEPPEPFSIERLTAIAAGPLVLGAGLSGGLRSPAAVLVALCTAAASRGRGGTGAVIRALLAFAALLLGHAILIGEPEVGALIWTAALVLGLGVLPEWQREKSATLIAQARLRTDRLEQWLGVNRPTPAGGSIAVRGSRREITLAPVGDAGMRENEVLRSFLRDARDVLGAEEVVYWRWTPARDALELAGHSGEGQGPAQFAERWRPLLDWSARERMIHFDDGSEPRFAVAPVGSAAATDGALSASAPTGFSMEPVALKAWMPRIAAHVAHLSELIETRQEYRRQNEHTRVLMRAVQSFQQNKPVAELAKSICENALHLTSARAAVLVRWHADRGSGEVQSSSGESPPRLGTLVEGDSYVGMLCRNGVPQVWEDARSLSREVPIYTTGGIAPPLGSLAIVPLRRDDRVMGAIVIEGDSPRDVLEKDARSINLLAAVTSVSLETVWEVAEVSRRALTDQLTGLSNRRSFDEQFGRMLAEADRFGHPVSLIIADIDFFKKVNDTYGHDAGDQVLRKVAAAIQEGVREVDVCARFGGEELAVLLPQTSLPAALEVAERLRSSIEQRVVQYKGTEIRVTASFGVSTYLESARSRDAFFLSADRSLYQAKAAGRNRVKSAVVTPS